MRDYDGEQDFPIWLVGDSPPKESDQLDTPLDWRHPTRHSIWTPIETVIQRLLYDWGKCKLASDDIYVINSINIENYNKPQSLKKWNEKANNKDDEISLRIGELISMIEDYKIRNPEKPLTLFTFGNFSYEMIRRTLNIGKPRKHSYWSIKLLGDEFRISVSNFCTNNVSVFPLLHATVARRFYMKAHNDYCWDDYENIRKVNTIYFPTSKNYFFLCRIPLSNNII